MAGRGDAKDARPLRPADGRHRRHSEADGEGALISTGCSITESLRNSGPS
jgi:hypothetical protein